MIAILNWSGGMCGATQVVGIFPDLSSAKEWVKIDYFGQNLLYSM